MVIKWLYGLALREKIAFVKLLVRTYDVSSHEYVLVQNKQIKPLPSTNYARTHHN